jgi:hypothetical protein
MDHLIEKNPDIIFYSKKIFLKDFEILAKSSSATEYIAPNYNIYSDPALTNSIGLITHKTLIDGNITSFTDYVLFPEYNCALTFYAININGFEQNVYYDTIIAGSGFLLGSTGIVAVLVDVNKTYNTYYVYLTNKKYIN